jgi:hypothetical protein
MQAQRPPRELQKLSEEMALQKARAVKAEALKSEILLLPG